MATWHGVDKNVLNAPKNVTKLAHQPPVAMPTHHDPYSLSPADVQPPPRSLSQALRFVGPGMVLAASIVGSGELIATTTLGAEVGYRALWIVLFSCLIKPIIQAEMGRYTIVSGQTGLAGFNTVPGPKWRINWVVAGWVVMTLITQLQIGAMFAGVAQVMHLLLPAVSVRAWVLVFLVLTLALLLGGGYARIERLAMFKVGFFTLITLMAALVLLRMPEYFSWPQLAEGFRLQLPQQGLSTGVAVFGIVGVGAAELFMYPYWCVEKGYARSTGPADALAAWVERAKGWIKVMHTDILVSMLVYTLATVAFYLLGAGILHGMGLVPASKDMIVTLSNIYTQTLGPWSLGLFYAGAVATLYGTIFASTAANSRVFADLMHLLGFFEGHHYPTRLRFQRAFTVLLTVLPVLLYFWIEAPVQMVLAGGIAQSLMLPVIGVGTLYLHHRHIPQALRPSWLVTVALWAAVLLISAAMGYYVWSKFY
jgi:manganese transport protein